MEIKPFLTKISDLPTEISISVDSGLSREKLEEIAEDLKSQILYNSRNDEDEVLPDLKLSVITQSAESIVFKASIETVA